DETKGRPMPGPAAGPSEGVRPPGAARRRDRRAEETAERIPAKLPPAVTLPIVLQLTLFGLVWGGLYALTAHGLNLIYGVMKILNIAHGEFVMLGAYTTFWLLTLAGVSPLLSVLVAAPAAFLLGLLIHAVVVAPLVRASGGSVVALEQSTL